MRKLHFIYLLAAALISIIPACKKAPKYKALIITGQSEYNWKVSSESAKQILDLTGLFKTDIIISPEKGGDMSSFSPAFADYDLVVSNYYDDPLNEGTVSALTEFVKEGGGLVIYNSLSDRVAVSSETVSVTKRHDFEIRNAITNHPVTEGLPVRWVHQADLIRNGLQITGEGSQVLATAYSDTAYSGSGRREPVMIAWNLGKGRIFATMIGTPDDNENNALHCAGFIVTLQRGAEWAASGTVTREVPFDFPTAAGPVLRPDFTEITYDEIFENIRDYDISKSTKYFACLQSMIRKAEGDEEKLLEIEKKMVKVLEDDKAATEAKKLLLREISWMGSENCLPAIEALSSVQELADDVEFALDRLQ
ncbi:MAG: ThuA domain-containing protein [Bacteroidota bacterium]